MNLTYPQLLAHRARVVKTASTLPRYRKSRSYREGLAAIDAQIAQSAKQAEAIGAIEFAARTGGA